ncbi:MAG: winged helix-turn-helix domain-containing protein [Hellea sp.]
MANNQIDSMVFYLGPFEIRPTQNMILFEGEQAFLEPQVMKVLHVLSSYGESAAPRHELVEDAWDKGIGTDESLSRSISILRKTFGKFIKGSEVILTVHKRGYRLSMPVTYPFVLTEKNEDSPSSIAVLLFTDLSLDKTDKYLAQGVSEGILNELSNVPNLRVVSRSSAFAFDRSNLDLQLVAKSLNVKYILQGSIRRSTGRLFISAQLTHIDMNSQIWSQDYNIAMEHIFNVQDAIAGSITHALTKKLSLETPRQSQNMTENTDAYVFYLQGRALNQRNYVEGATERAKSFLNQAIEIDPEFAQAHVELARSYLRESVYVKRSQKRGKIKQAADIARQALELDARQVSAMTIIAQKMFIEGDVITAIDLLKMAFEQQPNSSEIASELGCYFLAIGLVKVAIPYLEKAVALDPVQGRPIQVLAIAKLSNGDLDVAHKLSKRALDLGYAYAVDTYAAVAYAMGDGDLAMKRMMSLPQNTLNNLGPSFSKKETWESGIKGFYGGDEAVSQFMTQSAFAMLNDSDVMDEDSPAELLLAMCLLRGGGAKELFAFIGDAPPPGSHAVLLNLWGEGKPYSKIYNHPDFLEFADRIGFAKAWRKYGWPDRLP